MASKRHRSVLTANLLDIMRFVKTLTREQFNEWLAPHAYTGGLGAIRHRHPAEQTMRFRFFQCTWDQEVTEETALDYQGTSILVGMHLEPECAACMSSVCLPTRLSEDMHCSRRLSPSFVMGVLNHRSRVSDELTAALSEVLPHGGLAELVMEHAGISIVN